VLQWPSCHHHLMVQLWCSRWSCLHNMPASSASLHGHHRHLRHHTSRAWHGWIILPYPASSYFNGDHFELLAGRSMRNRDIDYHDRRRNFDHHYSAARTNQHDRVNDDNSIAWLGDDFHSRFDGVFDHNDSVAGFHNHGRIDIDCEKSR
jgi:hypothetical protein